MSAERVLEGIKDECVMVASDTANKHNQTPADVKLHNNGGRESVFTSSGGQSVDAAGEDVIMKMY